ncbi:MAG TPA: phospholipase D-like domain-containing protein [Steroidobacteraceae bacterium]|nr:phospholipase D-like domain-containing protein [Steroidobacteraceae bacterium]
MSASTPRDPTYAKFAEALLSRAAGAPLIAGNAVDLLTDGEAHFLAWLGAIRGARRQVLLENYIFRDDVVGVEFRDALAERARAGVAVAVIVDWLGCLGQSRQRFWGPLRAAGGEVRTYNPPRIGASLAWVSRDHRKLLVVDGREGFLSGVCISAKWLGDRARGVPPWRDSGVALHGAAVAALQSAFLDSWESLGPPLDEIPADAAPVPAGTVALRVIATQPASATLYRLDQLVAAMARRTLWLTDAYYVGIAPYVQALVGAARDGVDVRLLVPGASDVPLIAAMSRSGYRPLLRAGIRIYEWNGSMLHAKTAVVDGLWSRIGSSNLNLSSWLGNREIDVAIEDEDVAARMAAQYERDLGNATEIVLATRRFRGGERVGASDSASPPRSRAIRRAGGSSRAAVGALQIATSVGVALRAHRVLGDTTSGPLAATAAALAAFGACAFLWPRVVAWPIAAACAWLALNLIVRQWRQRRHRRRWREFEARRGEPPPAR